MSHRIVVFYGPYRSNRMGIRLANYLVAQLRKRGEDVELIDAKALGLPMLDRMYKDTNQALPRRRWNCSQPRFAPRMPSSS